jgi:tetratricopeptide (TPR) repeat protein
MQQQATANKRGRNVCSSFRPYNPARLRARRIHPSLLAFGILLAVIVGCGNERPDPLEHVREIHANGRFAESIEPLRDLVAERSYDPEVHYLYGKALRQNGQPSLALWSLRKAREHPDWQVASNLEIAAVGLEGRNWEATIEAAGQVLESDPGNVEALVMRGEARLEQRSDRTGALSDFERALELEPESFPIQLSRVAALLALLRIEEAEEAIGELETLARDRQLADSALAGLCVAKATFTHEKGETDEASTLYTSCLKEFPTDAAVLVEATSFFDENGRSDRSVEALRAAVEHAPHAVNHRSALAGRLRAAGAVSEAEQVIRDGIGLESSAHDAYSWIALADHYVAIEDYAAAAEALGKALELDHDPPPQRLLAYADLLAMAGENEKALEAAEALEPEFYGDIVRARVLLNERKPRQALDRLDVVLRQWPNNAAARYYAARAAEQAGDLDRAIEEYRQSIRAGAAFSDAGLRLARLHEAEGAFETALFAAQRHLEAHPGDPEGVLLAVQLSQRAPHIPIPELLAPLQRPALWARAVPIRATAAAERGGSGAAVALVRSDPRLDLAHPRDAAALRTLVIHLMNVAKQDEAQLAVEAALAAHPDDGQFHAIHGLILERQGAAPQVQREVFERALALDPEHAPALLALAKLSARSGDREGALALYDRAAAADPVDPGAPRAAAALLAQSGRADEAEQRLEEHLREHAYDAKAAMQLADLRLARGAASDATLELAKRAMRFRGGSEAHELLVRVHRARGARNFDARAD